MREVFNAIQFILGTGCQWRALPKCFPPFTSVQNYFCEWSRTYQCITLESGLFSFSLFASQARMAWMAMTD